MHCVCHDAFHQIPVPGALLLHPSQKTISSLWVSLSLLQTPAVRVVYICLFELDIG